ncbi:MAG: LysM peptidoglycan-binding domain-containing protein [bacterium]|nr:LysM peptidoglycan-binding domain-containing protein [bacterium]
MRKMVPFTKEIKFKTMISKITSISLEHTLSVDDNNTISGYFILEGSYKMTQASQIDEEFSYKIPVEIQIDDKYDTKDIILDIDDFTYEVLNEETLKLNISLCIDKLEEKEEILKIGEIEDEKDEILKIDETEDEKKLGGERAVEILDNLFMDTSESIDLQIPKKNEQENVDNEEQSTSSLDDNNTVGSLFSSFKDNIETFKAYSVYIVKESDTIDSIMKKYGVDKEMLEEYNNLSEINIGSKIIIPCAK